MEVEEGVEGEPLPVSRTLDGERPHAPRHDGGEAS
jgi:hypothetical protein